MKIQFYREHGVSPVIGTILMVSITVVLAATLYLVVTGIEVTPMTTITSGSFADKEKVNLTSYKLIFSDFRPATHITSLKFVLLINGTHRYTVNFPSDYTNTQANITPEDIYLGSLTITYYDNSNNTFINSGDYLLVKNMKISTPYELYVLDSHGTEISSITFEA